MKNLLYIAVLLISLTYGCKTTRAVQISNSDSTVHRSDSGYVETVEDTLVPIVSEDAYLKALLECDSNRNVHVKQITETKSGTHARVPDISLNKNELTVNNRVDSFAVYVSWKNRHSWSTKQDAEIRQTTVTVTEKVNYLTWWQKVFIKIGKISSVLLILFGIYKVLTNRLKIIQQLRKWVA